MGFPVDDHSSWPDPIEWGLLLMSIPVRALQFVDISVSSILVNTNPSL